MIGTKPYAKLKYREVKGRQMASLNSWSSSCSRLPQAIKSPKVSSSPAAEDVARTGPPSFASLASVRDSLIFLEPRAPSIASPELEQRLRRTMGSLPSFIIGRRFAEAHQKPDY